MGTLVRSCIGVILAIVLACVAGPASAQESYGSRQCVGCWESFTQDIGLAEVACFLEPQPICATCATLETRCFECNLPVKNRGKRLEDGRISCAQHAPSAVETLQGAYALFKEVERDLMHMLSGLGTLPDTNVELELIDSKKMGGLLQQGRLLHPARSAVGLSRASMGADGRVRHHIWILSGLSANRFAAVAAHEYMHGWVAENVRRAIEAATVEGFCELMALKLTEARGDRAQQQVILANTYTQGRIHALQRAAQSYQVPRIVDWIKHGMDPAAPTADPARVLVLNQPAPEVFRAGAPARTPVPDSLTLRGISGRAGQRFALINDRTFEENEADRVRVGSTNLMLRCLKIAERAVVVQLLESGERQTLTLPAEKLFR